MSVQDLKTKLEKQIETKKPDQFFEEAQLLIASDAAIQPLLMVLKSRYNMLKMDRIKGVLSNEEERKAEQELLADILDLISLIDEDCLIDEPVNIKSLWKEIARIQKEMESVTNDRTEGIIKAGEALQKLGSILQGEPGFMEHNIPLEQLISSASTKARRKMTIAAKELVAVRRYQHQAFNSMMVQYRKLLDYLDYPKDPINAEHKQLLKLALQRLKTYMAKLELAPQTIQNSFEQVLPFLDMVIANKGAVPGLTDQVIIDFREMRLETQSILAFYKQDAEHSKLLSSKLNQIAVELELSLGELS